MYTTPLSTLISPLSLNHHLYADDTQLFFSFHPPDFDSRTTHLQDSLQQISSWTTANLSTLNSSKTELLLIGFTKQHSKMQNSSLNTTHSARNLGFIFDEHLTFSDQISSVSKSCYYDMIWYDMIWYDYFNVHLKADKCQLNLPHPNQKLKPEKTLKHKNGYAQKIRCRARNHGVSPGEEKESRVERICGTGRFWAWSETATEWWMMRVASRRGKLR